MQTQRKRRTHFILRDPSTESQSETFEAVRTEYCRELGKEISVVSDESVEVRKTSGISIAKSIYDAMKLRVGRIYLLINKVLSSRKEIMSFGT